MNITKRAFSTVSGVVLAGTLTVSGAMSASAAAYPVRDFNDSRTCAEYGYDHYEGTGIWWECYTNSDNGYTLWADTPFQD